MGKRAKLSRIHSIKPKCIECGKLAKLVTGAAIYPHRPDLAHKSFYLCECGARVGCHPGSAVPLGLPAGTVTRKWRSAAHAAFDPLWKGRPGGARSKGYRWLADQLGIPGPDCHISWFDAETCRRVVEICTPHLHKVKRHKAQGTGT